MLLSLCPPGYASFRTIRCPLFRLALSCPNALPPTFPAGIRRFLLRFSLAPAACTLCRASHLGGRAKRILPPLTAGLGSFLHRPLPSSDRPCLKRLLRLLQRWLRQRRLMPDPRPPLATSLNCNNAAVSKTAALLHKPQGSDLVHRFSVGWPGVFHQSLAAR